jgi:type I restriction enzyme S subunit
VKTVALGEVVDFYSGGTPSKSNTAFWEGAVPWFSAKDLKRPRLSDSVDHVSETVFRETPLRLLPAGTVTMVVRGMILAHTVPISILDVDAAINQDLKALLPRVAMEPSYLAAMLRAQHHVILSQVSTAAHGTKKLDSRVLEQLRIPLPPIDEQRRIAAILGQASALLAQRGEVLGHLNSLSQSIFLDMFGKESWSSTLGELAEVQIGPFGSLLHQADYVSGGVPLINPMHIRDGKLQPDREFSVDEEKAKSLHLYRLRHGDVVLGRRGEMGRAGIVHPEHEGLLCGTGSLVLRPRNVDSHFLHAVVTSARMKAYLERSSLGATLANLNASIVKAAPAPRIPGDVQVEFASRLAEIERVNARYLEAWELATKLCDSLQSRAFRGEL